MIAAARNNLVAEARAFLRSAGLDARATNADCACTVLVSRYREIDIDTMVNGALDIIDQAPTPLIVTNRVSYYTESILIYVDIDDAKIADAERSRFRASMEHVVTVELGYVRRSLGLDAPVKCIDCGSINTSEDPEDPNYFVKCLDCGAMFIPRLTATGIEENHE